MEYTNSDCLYVTVFIVLAVSYVRFAYLEGRAGKHLDAALSVVLAALLVGLALQKMVLR